MGSTKKPATGNKGGSKYSGGNSGSATVVLDEDWIIEHAAQASRILPGGLDILGLFVFCEESAFQPSQVLFSKLIKGMQREILNNGDVATLVLHIDAITAKVAVREIDSFSSSLRPCEVKQAPLIANMICVKCSYSIDMHLSLASGKTALHAAIDKAIQWEYDNKITPAIPLLKTDQSHAIMPSLDMPFVEVLAAAIPERSSNAATEIQLLVPLGSASLPPTPPAVGLTTVTSMQERDNEYKQLCSFMLAGSMDCRAFIHKREPLRAAVDSIKNDIQRSMRARMGVLVEAADMATNVAEEKRNQAMQRGDVGADKDPLPRHPLLLPVDEARVYCPALPRRAFLPWKQGGGCYCDYLVEGEGVIEATQRIHELMGEECVDGFECLENTGGNSTKGAGAVPKSGGGSGVDSMMMVAIIVLIVAILVGLYLTLT